MFHSPSKPKGPRPGGGFQPTECTCGCHVGQKAPSSPPEGIPVVTSGNGTQTPSWAEKVKMIREILGPDVPATFGAGFSPETQARILQLQALGKSLLEGLPRKPSALPPIHYTKGRVLQPVNLGAVLVRTDMGDVEVPCGFLPFRGLTLQVGDSINILMTIDPR